MENTNILIDTSVLIQYLRASNKENTLLIKAFMTKNCFISSITAFELYIGATSESKKQDCHKIIQSLEFLPFDYAQAQIAADIYLRPQKQKSNIEFRDILIAASAVSHEYAFAYT